MTTFLKTRAAASYICRHTRGDLTLSRALALLAQLDACEAALADGNGAMPAPVQRQLGELVRAARDLAGPTWLTAGGGDPDIAAFAALDRTPCPPGPGTLDEIISRMLWARFGPPHAAGRHHHRNRLRS